MYPPVLYLSPKIYVWVLEFHKTARSSGCAQHNVGSILQSQQSSLVDIAFHLTTSSSQSLQ